MRITAATAWVESFQLTRPYTIAFKSFDSADNMILRIEAGGRIGLGAASPMEEVTGENFQACEQNLTPERLEWLIGKDVRELPALCRENRRLTATTPAAGAAVDMALHDLLGQVIDKPVADMLGRAHHALPTSITIGIKSSVETIEEADEYLGRGFKILKVKLGRSLDEDVERLRKLREHVGDRTRIRVDPNQAYSRRDVEVFFSKTEDLSIEFVEQPMPAGDLAGMRALPESIRQKLAADESLLSDRDSLALAIPPRACGIFNVKLMKCGGIHCALRIATVAELADIHLMWGCMDESRISIAAALHAALACPATRYLDLDGSFDLARDVAEGGFHLRDGQLSVSDAPGLGLTLVS